MQYLDLWEDTVIEKVKGGSPNSQGSEGQKARL